MAREQVGRLRAEILQATRVGELQSELATHRTDHDRRVDDLRSELASVRHDRDICTQRLNDVTTDLAAVRVSLKEFIAQQNDVTTDLAAVRVSLKELIAQQNEVDSNRPAVEDRLRATTSLVEVFRCSLQLLLGPTGRHLTRLVSEDELDGLISELAVINDREQVVVAVHQAYRTLLELEMRCVGRLAGSTSNILARLAAVSLMPPPSGEVLEIATLFGVGAVGLARQLARIGLDTHLTLVDSFAGDQIEPDRTNFTDVSCTPVAQVSVTNNLALGGVATERYRLIEGTSDSPEVQRIVGDRQYGLVVIGGGHPEEAALAKLVWVESVVLPGALVVFDDFGDPAWPEVENALDRYLARPDAKLRLIGTAATSAFLRAT